MVEEGQTGVDGTAYELHMKSSSWAIRVPDRLEYCVNIKLEHLEMNSLPMDRSIIKPIGPESPINLYSLGQTNKMLRMP